MKYDLLNAHIDDVNYLKSAKLYSIFKYVHDLSEEEIIRVNRYVEKHIPLEIEDYKLIICDNKRVGCLLVVKEADGIMLDEIYLEDEYRGKGIGSNIICNILENNNIIYLWVYKENISAVKLYKRLGFKIDQETDTRFYMKYIK